MPRIAAFFVAWLVTTGLVQADEVLKVDPAKLPLAATGSVDFTRDIQPIFAKNCISCHGPEKQRGGVRLDQRAAALTGGNSGPILVPGKAAASRLLIVVAGLDPDVTMPPKEKTPLSRTQIGQLRAWIEQGANWPEQAASADSGPKSNHWAFQPIRRLQPPAVKQAAWVHNDIDRFVLARLEKEGMAPSQQAELVTLIRRLSFDLIGLPPTPAEIDAFLKDAAGAKPQAAIEKLVERLLASPHYGERWGRHWLDLARYADSDGYEADRPRPYQWRYRDWVIAAFNRDMAFDEFTIEQLAGDLLPPLSQGGETAALTHKTATGFHRNTLTNREGGTDKEQFRVEACIDRVNTTAKVWLGLTLGCAQCHDHKYDPLSQREYYQFFAFFNSDEEVDVPAPLPGDFEAKAVFQKRKADLEKKVADYKKDHPDAKEGKDAQLIALTKALNEFVKTGPTSAFVPALGLGKGRITHVLLRGDFLRPGAVVEPGTPDVLPPLKAAGRSNRLDLARWLVSPDNPLTARVIANWIWHHYFGRGLVATLEDFGTQGEKPSHAELLDHLARKLIEGKWSMKDFHRYVVTSSTYLQSSKVRPELASRDPLNILLARQNRIRFEAEVLRDNALAVSGLLSRKIGGPSVKPPQPPGISELTYAGSAKWVESKGEDRYRRGLYTWFQRTSPYPMLTMFDSPDGVLSCVRRERTNTPLQALTLLNDSTFVECAQALAKRILAERAGSTAERLDYGFRMCVGRHTTTGEQDLLQRLYDGMVEACRANPKEAARLASESWAAPNRSEAAAWVAIARMLMNLDEFVTRE